MTPQRTPSPALDAMFPEFQRFLYESAGIYFPAQNRERLLGHVSARMAATDTRDPRRYLNLLSSSAGPGSEQWSFFNQTTVNETFFFRDEVQFTVFREKLLPELFAARRAARRPQLHILSAACSSGEEAYSLAILIHENFPSERDQVTITGIDINSHVIDLARQGSYAAYSTRMCSPQQMQTHFTRNGDRHQVKDQVRRNVTFRVGNMTDASTLRQLPRPDLILCRNALIYFDRESKMQVVNAFARLQAPGAYLFLGRTESLFGTEHPYELVHFYKSCGYRLRKTAP